MRSTAEGGSILVDSRLQCRLACMYSKAAECPQVIAWHEDKEETEEFDHRMKCQKITNCVVLPKVKEEKIEVG